MYYLWIKTTSRIYCCLGYTVALDDVTLTWFRYCSSLKKFPCVKHLTSLPKRVVGTLSSVSAFNHKWVPMYVYGSPCNYKPAIIDQYVLSSSGIQKCFTVNVVQFLHKFVVDKWPFHINCIITLCWLSSLCPGQEHVLWIHERLTLIGATVLESQQKVVLVQG